jgi:hypothetical protein
LVSPIRKRNVVVTQEFINWIINTKIHEQPEYTTFLDKEGGILIMDQCYIGTTFINDIMFLTYSMDQDDLVKSLQSSKLENVAEDLKKLSESIGIPVVKFDEY